MWSRVRNASELYVSILQAIIIIPPACNLVVDSVGRLSRARASRRSRPNGDPAPIDGGTDRPAVATPHSQVDVLAGGMLQHLQTVDVNICQKHAC